MTPAHSGGTTGILNSLALFIAIWDLAWLEPFLAMDKSWLFWALLKGEKVLIPPGEKREFSQFWGLLPVQPTGPRPF